MQQEQRDEEPMTAAEPPLPGPDVLILGSAGSVQAIEAAVTAEEPILILEPDWILADPPTLTMTVGTAVLTGAAIGAIALYARRMTRRRRVRRVTIIE